MHTSKIGNSSRIPNLASEIGALYHMFRDIEVFSASYRGGPFECRLEKSTENLNMFENRNLAHFPPACSPLESVDGLNPSTMAMVWGGLHACVTDVP